MVVEAQISMNTTVFRSIIRTCRLSRRTNASGVRLDPRWQIGVVALGQLVDVGRRHLGAGRLLANQGKLLDAGFAHFARCEFVMRQQLGGDAH